ncbi:Golgi phosphoprotein 3 (GPP34) [Actinopolyspora mzabensis]|uniref:Golgi phosphoprotein 3 (GPP34) n=1 Tax=Actinopolyspora mzabensis TaxID=995066 RepID=A0A1G8X8T2_ACTMZ|nr:GPP34 family phosphoprotein [Actinopolyspora mzabensis]SDJ86726.1 Golgi phosphoprotein 3 (GPP34) [Actinopolyspora mzabensis]
MEAHLSLSLPAQIVLLLHGPDGRQHHGVNHQVLTPAAELAELVLYGRAELNRSALGGVKIGLLDSTPVGFEPLERPLSALAGRIEGKGKPLPFHTWLSERRGAFREQRWALRQQGYLEYEPEKLLGFIPRDRYRPHGPLQQELIGELGQLARGERSPDDRLALLVAIVHPAGLPRRLLGFDRSQGRRLKHIAKGQDLEGAVSAAVAATGAAIGAAVAGGAGGGDGGGGDGGGGS